MAVFTLSHADYFKTETPLTRGNLLVANRDMRDPTFGNTVIMILNRDDKGTFGIILNRKSNISVTEVMPGTDWSGGPPHVYLGGPVAINSVRILIHSEQHLPLGTMITDNVWIIDTEEALANYSTGMADSLSTNVYLGYAGWLPGQLEAEIMRGDWHIWPGDAAAVFSETPENLWFEIQQYIQQIWAGLTPGSNNLPEEA